MRLLDGSKKLFVNVLERDWLNDRPASLGQEPRIPGAADRYQYDFPPASPFVAFQQDQPSIADYDTFESNQQPSKQLSINTTSNFKACISAPFFKSSPLRLANVQSSPIPLVNVQWYSNFGPLVNVQWYPHFYPRVNVPGYRSSRLHRALPLRGHAVCLDSTDTANNDASLILIYGLLVTSNATFRIALGHLWPHMGLLTKPRPNNFRDG